MIRDLKITFEMELDRVEEHMPAHRLRAMWEFTMDLLSQFQEAALSRDGEDSFCMSYDIKQNSKTCIQLGTTVAVTLSN